MAAGAASAGAGDADGVGTASDGKGGRSGGGGGWVGCTALGVGASGAEVGSGLVREARRVAGSATGKPSLMVSFSAGTGSTPTGRDGPLTWSAAGIAAVLAAGARLASSGSPPLIVPVSDGTGWTLTGFVMGRPWAQPARASPSIPVTRRRFIGTLGERRHDRAWGKQGRRTG
jgi:hypothetical protein